MYAHGDVMDGQEKTRIALWHGGLFTSGGGLRYLSSIVSSKEFLSLLTVADWVVALVPVVLGCMGVYVSLRPPRSESRWVWVWVLAFGFVGFGSGFATLWQTAVDRFEAKRGGRAYLQISRVEPLGIPQPGIPFKFNVWLKHFGGPAHNVRLNYIVEQMAAGIEAEDSLYQRLLERPHPMPPKAGSDVADGKEIWFTTEGIILDREQWSLVQSGERPIYIMLIATYRDSVGDHTINQCRSFFGKDIRVIRLCLTHNTIE